MPAQAGSPAKQAAETLPLDELNALTDAYLRIKSSYVEEVNDKELIEAAISGMLKSLDPHSRYLSRTQLKELRSSTAGEFGGLGLELTADKENGYVKVVRPMEGTPAAKAGLKAGDLITAIDRKPLNELKFDAALTLMEGAIGEPITLSVLRGEERMHFNLVRDRIQVRSVSARMLEDGVGYIAIDQFQSKTGKEFEKAIKQLQQQQPLQGLVLDLRNNPGGVLRASVEVSDALLEDGVIVSTRGRTKRATRTHSAESGDLMKGAPVVVLVNDRSASASEIVAGALQDHKRALIMGTRSFGKGSVQSVMTIEGDAAVKFTTSRYYTPSGRSIQGEGIHPDIEVAAGKIVTESRKNVRHESDLPGALKNDSPELSKTANNTASYNDDLQLSEAVKVLRGYQLLRLAQRD